MYATKKELKEGTMCLFCLYLSILHTILQYMITYYLYLILGILIIIVLFKETKIVILQLLFVVNSSNFLIFTQNIIIKLLDQSNCSEKVSRGYYRKKSHILSLKTKIGQRNTPLPSNAWFILKTNMGEGGGV